MLCIRRQAISVNLAKAMLGEGAPIFALFCWGLCVPRTSDRVPQGQNNLRGLFWHSVANNCVTIAGACRQTIVPHGVTRASGSVEVHRCASKNHFFS